MNRLTRNLTALATGFAMGGLLVISADANAAKVNMPIKGNVNSVRDGFFKPSTGNPTTSYTVGQTTPRDVTSTGTDVTVTRETPFGFKNKFNQAMSGVVIDAIKFEKPALGGLMKGLFRGGLWGLGMGLAVEGLVGLGYQWYQDASNFGQFNYGNPPGVNINDYVYFKWASSYPTSLRETASSPWLPTTVLYPTCYKKLTETQNGYTFILQSAEYPTVTGASNYNCTYTQYAPNGSTSTVVKSWTAQNPAKPVIPISRLLHSLTRNGLKPPQGLPTRIHKKPLTRLLPAASRLNTKF